MKTILSVKGFHCESCVKLVEDICRETKGVKSCTVSKDGRVEITHDNADLAAIKKEIEDSGYKVIG